MSGDHNPPPGPRSTVGYPLPSAAGRGVGDLHTDNLTGRQYVLTNLGGWQLSQGGSVGSAHASIPPTLDRGAGDVHVDTNTGKSYHLIAPYTTFRADTFSRQDSTSLGTTEESGVGQGATWTKTGTTRIAVQKLRADAGTSTASLGTGDSMETSVGVTISREDATDTGDLSVWLAGTATGWRLKLTASTGIVTLIDKLGSVRYTGEGVAVGASVNFQLRISDDGKNVTLLRNGIFQVAVTYSGAGGEQIADGVTLAWTNVLRCTVDNVILSQRPTWDLISAAVQNVNSVAATGSTETIPELYGSTGATMHRLVLTANCTLTFPAAAAGKWFSLELVQDGTGTRTVTWPGTVKWPGGTNPVLTVTANKTDAFTFRCMDGTNWRGSIDGQNIV